MSEITLDDVAKSVHDLTESVTGMQAGLVDKETVERIAGEVLERQKAAAPEQNRRRSGYQPDDTEVSETELPKRFTGKNRMREIHSRNAKSVARAARLREDDVVEFHERADNLLLLATALDCHPRDTRYYTEEYLPFVRALDSTTSAEGDEFVPTELSASLIERVNLPLRVAALFPTIPMPTNPFDIPGRGVSRQRLGKHAEQTADTGQTRFKAVTPATRKITLTAVKFAGEMIVSKEVEEDALIAMLPFMQEEMIDFLAGDIEDAIINGDAQGSHMDSDTTSSDDPRKALDGLRQHTQSTEKTDGSSASKLTVAHLRTNRAQLGKYGINPADLAHVVSMNSYLQLLDDSNVVTVDKIGPSATIVTGELGRVDGIPLVVSEYVRTDLNASGVYDGSTTTETIALTVYRRGFLNGIRREMTVQRLVEIYAEFDQDAIICSHRRAFQPRFPVATEPLVALTYNLDS